MKIKTVKKMRLDELLKHVWHEGGEHKTYMSNEGKSVDIDDSGIQFLNDYKINKGIVLSRETFTVEVCEELTEKTELDGLVAITNHDKIRLIDNIHTIESALSFEKTYERYENIYGKSDGELKLIWSRDSGIPESGVLEVDDE